jgi:hypothetical protein
MLISHGSASAIRRDRSGDIVFLTPLGDTPPVMRRGLAPVTLVIAVALEIWLLTGVALNEIARFVGYEIGFVALPGVALLWALRGRPRGLLESVGLGLPLGQALEILAFSATAAAGARWLFSVYPVAVVGLGALVIWKRRGTRTPVTPAAQMSGRLMWTSALTLSAGLIYLAIMFIPQSPLPSTRASVSYSPDFVYQMSKTAEVLYHWPATNPGLSGVPLPYEWFLFVHMAAVSQVTHLAIPIVALRLDFVPLIVVVGCQLLMIGRVFAGTAMTGVIAMVVVLLLGPLDLTTDSAGSSPFFSIFSNHLWSSWTFLFGLIFFIPLLYLIAERLHATTWRTRSDAASWLLIALLMVGASGAKATILPVLLVGTGLYAGFAWFRDRTKPAPQLLMALGMEAVIFVATFVVIYRGGALYTGLGPLESLSRTLPVIDASSSSIPGVVRAFALPAAYAAGLGGMLLPLVGLLYVFRRRHRDRLRGHALCLSILGGGIIIANVFHQIGYSELYFQDTGYVAGCIVAADGLRLAWMDAGSSLPMSRRAIAIALCCWIAGLIALVVATSPTHHQSQIAVVRYLVLVVGCITFVAGCFVITKIRKRPTTGTLGLALIPLLAASALASPIEIAPTASLMLSGISVVHAEGGASAVRGLTPGLLAALQWLKAHSSVNDVIAVSNHWLDAAQTDGRYYYYSAFSERQVFIEGYDASRYEISTDLDTPAGANFAVRKQLNDAVFGDADAAALHTMTSQYSVRFLLMDAEDGDVDDDNVAVLQLGKVVYSNPAVTIVAVG